MRHVIVGNGPAALSAVEALRRTDPACDITVVAGEPVRAYKPCLLPRFVSGEIAEEQLALKGEDFYEKRRVTLLRGVAATGIRPAQNSVALADGSSLAYDRLLLACGAAPVVPPIPGLAGSGFLTFKGFDDAVALRALSALLGNVVVLGSGCVAVQVAEALAKLGMPVTLVARTERILRRILDTKVMRYLGKISYGLYVYHYAVIWFVSRIRDFGISEPIAKPLTLVLSAAATFLLAHLSFKYFEKPILDLKEEYFPLRTDDIKKATA